LAEPVRVMPLTEDNPSTKDESSPLLDWGASGSIGSLLMQMQKKEEEMRKLNKTLLDEEQALDLSASSATIMQDQDQAEEAPVQSAAQSELSHMDSATAKELDDAVTMRLSSAVGKDVQVLELPSLYKVLRKEEDRESLMTIDLPALSKADHYEERIGRDMRHLAVSIASCVDDPAEWRLFCQQIPGGVLPLIDCIREGAKNIRERRDDVPNSASADDMAVISSHYEESFLAASSACRALRDLAALSLDLAAVITDGLLRANAGEPLMQDLVTLLKYAHDADIDIAAPQTRRTRILNSVLRRTKPPSKWHMNFRRKRKGTNVYYIME
jgi:hypothetical protein